MPAHKPCEAIGIGGYFHRLAVLAHVEQLADILLDVAESLALRGAEAHRARSGRLEVSTSLERQRRARKGEQLVKVRRHRLRPAEQDVQEPHVLTLPRLAAGLASCRVDPVSADVCQLTWVSILGQLPWPSCFEIFSSSFSRRSSDGCVEKIVARF